MEKAENIFEKVRIGIKKYLKWYSYPFIYFVITGLVCLFAWYRPQIYPQETVKLVFITVAIVPTLIWAGVITMWIFAVVLFTLSSYHLKKRFPGISNWSGLRRLSKFWENLASKTPSFKKKEAPQSLWGKIANSFFYFLGFFLIFVGMALIFWIARPYFTLLLFSSKIETLEKKVEMETVQGNHIIIPSVLVDAPILEGLNERNLANGVCHLINSPTPGEGGNFILEGHNLAELGLSRSKNFFSLLEVVSEGTPVYVFYQGRKYTYKVKKKVYRDVSEPELYDTTPGERLTLITCVSTWSPTIYTNRRTVVIAYPEF